MTPVLTLVRSTFLTWRAAARQMTQQPTGGVILAFGGEGDPPRGYHLGAFADRLSRRRGDAPPVQR